MMDVAAMAGVSQATVSLVLNGSPGVKLAQSTRDRVFASAADLGYQFVPRRARRSQITRSTIVFVADEVSTDPWIPLAFEGASDRALDFGVTTALLVSHGDDEVEALLAPLLDQPGVLGYIYGTALTRLVEPAPSLKQKQSILINCYDRDGTLPGVLPADVAGGRLATERLLEAGRRRIGLINGQQGVDNSRNRLRGYKQALAAYDVGFDSALVRSGNWEPSSGYEMTHQLMQLPNPPDGIFCANDMMAMGCIDALRERGISVPGDVAVIGYDDREIAQFTHPPLTTLILPFYDMGQLAADMLLGETPFPDAGSPPTLVDCPLIERGSVGAQTSVPASK